MPPLMSNHGNFIVSLGDVCRYLARKAEALGVEIYPGFAASEVLFENDAVAGIATGDMGIGKDGHHKAGFARGMELRGKYTLFAEGARGSLSKVLIERFGLAQDREPQKFGIGLKELWQVAPEKHRRGLVQHTLGWPLNNGTGGGSFLYHFDDNLVAVGFVVHLNYHNPYLSPFEEFQRFKTHPLIRDTFAGGKRICYGARAITEGGWQSVPKLAFPGGALIGCAAGFVNVPRIKGSHNAMLSGMLAAEHAAAALAQGRANDELSAYEAAWRSSPIGRDLWRVRNAKPLWSKLGTLRRHRARRARHVDQHARLLAVRHAQARQAGFRDARARGAMHSPSPIKSPTASSPSTGCPRSICRTPITKRTSRCIFWCATPLCRNPRSTTSMPDRRRAIARPASMNGSRRRPAALRDQRAELRPLQDLRHQGPEPEHHLGAARRRRRAELSEYVTVRPALC